MADALLITALPDGSYHIKEAEDPAEAGQDQGEKPIDQTVKSCDDALKIVQQWLDEESEESGGAETGAEDDDSAGYGGDGSDGSPNPPAPSPADMKPMWDQEAASRDSSGYRTR